MIVFMKLLRTAISMRGRHGAGLMRRFSRGLGLGLLLVVLANTGIVASALAKEAVPVAADPVLEARVMKLSAELRCLVCQNQTIADSHSGLAVDLRDQVRLMMAKGQSDDEIRAYMTARYGDFVLYKPPFKPTTAVLWVAPPVLLVGALAGLFLLLRARQRTKPEAFDADTPEGDIDELTDPPTNPLSPSAARATRNGPQP